MKKQWFSYDESEGFSVHDTENEAREFAERALELELKDAPDGEWSEEVEYICWGEIRQAIVIKQRHPRSEGVDIGLEDCNAIQPTTLEKVNP